MKTLQEHYNSIQNGKGNKSQFLKQARQLFPQHITQYLDFDTSVRVLKSKQIINEAVGGVVSKGFDIFDWKKILAEEAKAEEKKISKEVENANDNAFQPSDMKNADNINFNEIMKGFYAELKDEKNHDKTAEEIKAIVVKNLAKDPLYYTKDGEFGTKGVGYTTEAPSLGEPKPAKGPHKSSGYGDLDTEKKVEKVKANVQDSLGEKEAKTSNPSKVKEMDITPQNSPGVKKMKIPGAEKKIKLKENKEDSNYDNEIYWIENEVDYVPEEIEVYEKWPEPYKTKALKALEYRKRNFNQMSKDKLDSLKENINKKYTHFAVRKSDNTIVNGWEYKDLDNESIKEYSKMDLKDQFPDSKPSEFTIITKAAIERKGIDPFDTKNWYKDGIAENDIYGVAGNPDEEADYKKSQIKLLDPISAQIADLEQELISTIDPERKAELEMKIKELQAGLQEEKLRSLVRNIIKEELKEGIHDKDILSRPSSNPDIEPFNRSSEELSREADDRSEIMLKSAYQNQIRDLTISDDELRYLLGGKGVKGFGGTPNAIEKIIKNRTK